MEMMILRRRAVEAAIDGLESAHLPVGAGGGQFEALVQDLPPSELAGLTRDENVVGAAQPMPLMLIEPFDVTSDAGAAGSEAAGGNVTWGVRAVKADTSPFSGKGAVVAVLDTGIQRNHDAFAGLTIVGRNFTQRSKTDTTIDPDAFDDAQGHGTHCAGTIFGRDVGGKRIGVAPGVAKALIGKVLGPGGGSTGTLFSAMSWALENGAHIISMSLGMDLVGFRESLKAQGMHERQATSTAMRVLVDNVRFFDKFGNMLRSGGAFSRSALVVAASGNESDRLGTRLGTGAFVLGAAYPSDTEDFLSVGALAETGDPAFPFKIAEFSNAGARLAAPGVNVVSAALGTSTSGLKPLSGTSMATPHVAGVAALWVQKLLLSGPATPQRIMDRVRESAVLPPGLDEADVGRGIPQAPQS
jgi:subtilisin family serine protease